MARRHFIDDRSETTEQIKRTSPRECVNIDINFISYRRVYRSVYRVMFYFTDNVATSSFHAYLRKAQVCVKMPTRRDHVNALIFSSPFSFLFFTLKPRVIRDPWQPIDRSYVSAREYQITGACSWTSDQSALRYSLYSDVGINKIRR